MPGKDETIETALATVRDLAQFMDRHPGKRDWAPAGVYDIEALLPSCQGLQAPLTVLRHLFRLGATCSTLQRPRLGCSAAPG